MTNKTDYTDDEWTVLLRAPMVAGLAISFADPGGPIELTKEVLAAQRTLSAPDSTEELLTAVSQDALAHAQHRENVMAGFKPKGATAVQQIIDELHKANDILTAKATPEEAAAFRTWIVAAAQASADAAGEGGFLGIGAEQVSGREHDMIDRIAKELSVDPA
jgi:hypothetical protein